MPLVRLTWLTLHLQNCGICNQRSSSERGQLPFKPEPHGQTGLRARGASFPTPGRLTVLAHFLLRRTVRPSPVSAAAAKAACVVALVAPCVVALAAAAVATMPWAAVWPVEVARSTSLTFVLVVLRFSVDTDSMCSFHTLLAGKISRIFSVKPVSDAQACSCSSSI